MGGPPGRDVDEPLQLWQVLLDELRRLRPDGAGLDDRRFDEAGASNARCLPILFGHVHSWSAAVGETDPAAAEEPGEGRRGPGTTPPLAALCFSGGGIRSATFNLGVLQGLAKLGLLGRFDYLSSVSGGGYIAGWLARWLHAAGGGAKGLAAVEQALAAAPPRDPECPEAQQVSYLRQYSNYLTPRLGLLSADTWTLVAIGVRNVLLNWLVLVPLLTAPLLVPLLAVARWPAAGPDIWRWLIVAAYALEGMGLFFTFRLRDFPKVAAGGGAGGKAKTARGPHYLLAGLVPRLLALPLLLLGFYRYLGDHHQVPPTLRCLLLPSLAWAVGLPLVALWLSRLVLGREVPALWWDSVSLLVAGAFEATILAAVFAGWAPALAASRYPLYPILGPGLVFGPVLLGRTLFVALASIAEHMQTLEFGDYDREWWARWSAWALISAVVWIAGSALVLLAPTLLASATAQAAAVISTGGLGALVAFLGKSAGTPAVREPGGEQEAKGGSRLAQVLLGLAAPLFVLLVVLCLSAAAQHLLAAYEGQHRWPPAKTTATTAEVEAAGHQPSAWRYVAPYDAAGYVALGAIAALVLLGLGAGYPVNVNRFSMQAGYRNRLIRAYLGASNDRRKPNLFTGFDAADNVLLGKLRRNRPFPVINLTLNLVAGKNLAWQERKAESFTATPLHCGAAGLGYRPTQEYGGYDGLSLGTAVATSGAAANPNMGFSSSPAITFIMALFTVRLGAWLGNPRSSGRYAPYKRSGPRCSAIQLLAEAFGWTDENHPYVSLSDGGHFEDLGLYEMVRRRCRFILACDAGADPQYGFKDLGNAIRKIRIDFGISIVFTDRVYILPKKGSGEAASKEARYCAVAEIRYGDVDQDAKPGTLIYVKPSICEQLRPTPFDVANYARFSPDFPHESTADQWFSETQFESYRGLGEDAVSAMALYRPCASLQELIRRVEADYLPKSKREDEARQVTGESGGG
ncbi:MAG TPA: patatin-like phospholipase family protein [Thermoanaerobaculia bacterium]|nr:patatin-like phospholipase family protein [Thermoanaerobaculia bacterium]